MCLPTEALRIEGGGVIKTHLKKADAVKQLKEKAFSFIKKSEQDAASGTAFPQEFNTFLGNISKFVEDLKFMKASGTAVVTAGLRQMSDENLEVLKDIMNISGSGRRGSSEERLMKCIYEMFGSMSMMDAAKIAIDQKQEKVAQDLVSIYIDEYFLYAGGAARFNNEGFVKDIEKEQTRREVLHEHPAPPPTEDVEVDGAGSNGSGCTIGWAVWRVTCYLHMLSVFQTINVFIVYHQHMSSVVGF